uniref:Uncharacterized protein n=1 Tax=Globodera pallida TaxID=36090 RepID=A0A183C529_GLOPA
MGSNYSSANSAPYQYAFPPRKKRKMRSSESNHFDKNYLIEGTQFWAEKQYRKDSYFFQTSKRQSRENFAEIYGKAPTEYGSPSVSCWAFSGSSPASSCSVLKESVALPSPPRPPSSAPWPSPVQQNAAKNGAQRGSRPPAGIRAKYLPTLG